MTDHLGLSGFGDRNPIKRLVLDGPGEPYITGYRIGTVCTNLAFIAGAARLVWWTTRARASSDSIAVPAPPRLHTRGACGSAPSILHVIAT